MKYHIDFDIELLKNPYKGLYIALEGIDGAGKTTQAKDLKEYFESQGREVILTREPRKEGILGDLTYQILHSKIKFPAAAIQYLFSADRVIHHEQIVKPALQSGKVVITDRSFWSAVVYGILDKGDKSRNSVNQILIAQGILSMYHQFISPDKTFYLRIPVDESLRRISKKEDKELYETKAKIEKAFDGYEWVSKEFKEEIVTLDGTINEKGVTSRIIKETQNK